MSLMITEEERMRTLFLMQKMERVMQGLQLSLSRVPEPLTADWLQTLATDPAREEIMETLSARFGRAQDMLGGKLLPQLLKLQAEPPMATIDMLNHAERMAYLPSAQRWLAARNLRNQLVHEYLDSPQAVVDALQGIREMANDCLVMHSALTVALQKIMATNVAGEDL